MFADAKTGTKATGTPSDVSVMDQPGLLFPDIISNHGQFLGQKAAIICGEDRLSWSEFNARTNKVANALIALGVKSGDKICVQMGTSLRAVEIVWGVIKAGAVVVPLNLMISADSLARMINNSDARILVVDKASAQQVSLIKDQLEKLKSGGIFVAGDSAPSWPSADSLIDAASEDDPAVPLKMSDSVTIIYSSGTTGTPKGIELSHFARHNYALGVGPLIGMDRSTVTISTTPLYTNGTWMMMLPTLYWGGTLVLLPKFSPKDFFRLVEQHRCTHTFMVPTQSVGILGDPGLGSSDLGSMRVILSAGAPLPASVYAGLRKALSHVAVYELYGQTEGFSTLAGPADFARGKQGSVGLPIFGADVRVLDKDGSELPAGNAGEIVGYGPGLMKGYYNDRERTEEVIWRGPLGRTYIKSGDVGHLDEDGYLYISGRAKDMIISGGINIFASDIETVFCEHPDIKEAVAIGVPHDKWGETPYLLAIRRPGATTSESELMEWGNARLGKYQRVARVEFRTDFPRASHDKIQKHVLRAPYWKGRASNI